MAHHFSIKDKDYIAVGSAFNLFIASKTPCALPGLEPEPQVDLLKLSAVEPILLETVRNKDQSTALPEWPEYERLVSNPVLAWHALYFLCHQAYDDEARIRFIQSIDDESFQPAMQALIGALADFFDSQRRPLTASALRTSIEAAAILTDRARAELETGLTAENVASAALEWAGGGSSNISAGSESVRATRTSRKSKGSKNSSGTARENADSP